MQGHRTTARHLSIALTAASIAFLVPSNPQAQPPHPPSPLISDVTFHWETHDRRAQGSDNWPITWSDDDHQYTSWGDGRGFDPTIAKASLGFARIEGVADNYQGFNVWEGPFDGKSYGIISIEGVLYAWWGPGSGRSSYDQTRLLISTDKGASWTKSTWDLTDVDAQLVMPTILNFGKDYAGARDNYVYHYFIRKEPTTTSGLSTHLGGEPPTGKIDLGRVPKDQMMDSSAYEFYAGLDGSGNPVWTSDASQRVPVFEDPQGVGWNASVSFNAGLGRYFLITEHTLTAAGWMGMFDAPEPWGPWTTVRYHETTPFGDGEVSNNTFFWNFSNKWLSADGLDFTLVFSGVNSNDSWNTVKGTFTLGTPDDTPPTVPGGLSATAQSESAIDLSWLPSSDPETAVSHYRIYRDGVQVAQSPTTTYTDSGLLEATTYTYTVSAVNVVGLESGQSASTSATTVADTTPPTLVSVGASGPTQIIVVFSEPVEDGSATAASNYAIDNGLTVSAASLASDLITVTLTTSPLIENIDYTLTVDNVTDRATTPNAIAPGTTAIFEYQSILIAEVRISDGGDDVEEEQDGSVGSVSLDLDLVENGPDHQTVGLRFHPLPVPQGATIVTAYVQFKVDKTDTGTTALVVEGQASDDAAPFANAFGDVTSRPRTSASTAWTPVPWTTVGEEGPDQRTPNIASVIQEIVNRPGWAAGNSLVLIISGSGTRRAESYDADAAGAPLLHVEYSGSIPPPIDPPPPPGNLQVE